jgi:hypothetical protein
VWGLKLLVYLKLLRHTCVTSPELTKPTSVRPHALVA